MATRTRKPASAKPAVSPAQILEDGPMIGGMLSAVTPEPPAVEPTSAPEPAPAPAESPAPAPFANDLATLEREPSRDELIREAAHRRFVERGMTPGDPVQDWLEAEAEVDGAGRPAA